jgi:hypothetical protein
VWREYLAEEPTAEVSGGAKRVPLVDGHRLVKTDTLWGWIRYGRHHGQVIEQGVPDGGERCTGSP